MLDKQKILDALQEDREEFQQSIERVETEKNTSEANKLFLKTRWQAMIDMIGYIVDDINEGVFDARK